MQKLAMLSLLAQSPQPMLANEVIEVGIAVGRDMAVGTG